MACEKSSQCKRYFHYIPSLRDEFSADDWIHQVALGLCPAKDVLYVKLKEDKSGGPAASQEELDEKLNRWLEGLDEITTRIALFYQDDNIKKGL